MSVYANFFQFLALDIGIQQSIDCDDLERIQNSVDKEAVRPLVNTIILIQFLIALIGCVSQQLQVF